jgi:hypothetical protein
MELALDYIKKTRLEIWSSFCQILCLVLHSTAVPLLLLVSILIMTRMS